MCVPYCLQQDVVGYSATSDAYMVEHSDGVHLWFSEALVKSELLVAWQAFLDKRQKVDAAEEAESKKKMESVSEAPVYLAFGLTKARK